MSLSRFFGHPTTRHVVPATHPFEAFFGPSPFFQQGFQQLERLSPKMDLVEEGDKVRISVELPALKKEDVTVQLDGNQLMISGQFKEEKGEGDKESKDYKVTERHLGSFARSIPVSPGLKESEIVAKMENGLLSIEFPKKAEESTVKKIDIVG